MFRCACRCTARGSEVSFDDDARSLARYCVIDEDTPDQNSVAGGRPPSNLHATACACYRTARYPEGWMTLGVCHVTERRNDLSVALGESFIPPVVAAHEVPYCLGSCANWPVCRIIAVRRSRRAFPRPAKGRRLRDYRIS